MNYRHAYHAGNFADVHKHAVLVAILSHLRRKDAPFCVIDTHSGRGMYDLAGMEAARTDEAHRGIGRVAECQPATATLVRYLGIVREFRPRFYPGSPVIAAKLLREPDRLVAIESQADEFLALQTCFAGVGNVRAVLADGYARLPNLLPPPERRGLILVDPPYESPDEADKIARALSLSVARFATGIFMVWHPLKSAALADALAGEIRSRSAARLLSLTLDIGRNETTSSDRLTASGLIVINPPYGLDVEMKGVQAELLSMLRQGADGDAKVKWLAGTP